MKKILFMTTVSRTINAFLIPQIQMYKEKGYHVDCVCNIDHDLHPVLRDLGVRIYHLPFSRTPLSISNWKAFRKLINLQRVKNYDTVYLHTPVAAFIGRLLKLYDRNISTVYMVHGFHFFKGGSKLNWFLYYPLEKLMTSLTDIMITINQEDYDLSKKLNIQRCHLIKGVGIDPKIYKPNRSLGNPIRFTYNIGDHEMMGLMIAELNANKNHKQMIKTIANLKNRGTTVKVLCLGDGPLKVQLINYIKKLGLEDQIFFIGHVSDVHPYLSACDFGLLFSKREGLPRSIMEFMAMGKPVIGTNIRGIKDMIIDNYNGFLVPLNNVNDSAMAINKLVSDVTLLKRMGRNSLKSVQPYQIDKILSEVNRIVL